MFVSANSDVAQVKRGALAGRDGKTVTVGQLNDNAQRNIFLVERALVPLCYTGRVETLLDVIFWEIPCCKQSLWVVSNL